MSHVERKDMGPPNDTTKHQHISVLVAVGSAVRYDTMYGYYFASLVGKKYKIGELFIFCQPLEYE